MKRLQKEHQERQDRITQQIQVLMSLMEASCIKLLTCH